MSDIKERLRKIAVIFKGDDLPSTGAMLVEAADHIATLEQESAANLQRALVAEKDAERLDFILDEHCAIQEFSAHDVPVYNLNWYEVGEQQALVYKTPREAIDAAMLANISTQEVG